MKEIPLTRGMVALVDDEDFEWINQWKWMYNGCGYAVREVNGTACYMHRVIMGTPKGMVTDHVNRNKLDNRRENLRICNMSQNKINDGLRSTNSSGYKGVQYVSNKRKRNKRWYAHIMHNYKNICIGYFYTPEEASLAYNKKALELYGEFAETNA